MCRGSARCLTSCSGYQGRVFSFALGCGDPVAELTSFQTSDSATQTAEPSLLGSLAQVLRRHGRDAEIHSPGQHSPWILQCLPDWCSELADLQSKHYTLFRINSKLCTIRGPVSDLVLASLSSLLWAALPLLAGYIPASLFLSNKSSNFPCQLLPTPGPSHLSSAGPGKMTTGIGSGMNI